MTTSTQRFRALHDDLLLLPCAWDAASAAVLGGLGYEAIGTTSAGVSWTLGHPDGSITGDALLESTKRIATATEALLSVDIEGGYSSSSADVASLVLQLADLGVVGVNLEDSTPDGQRAGEDFAEFLGALASQVRESTDLFLNARIDTWLTGSAGEHALHDVIHRASLYEQAGADGVFIPAVPSVQDAATVVQSVRVPVNVMAAGPGPALEEWRNAGVRRISTGMGLALSALGALEHAAQLWRADPTTAEGPVADFATLQHLLGNRASATPHHEMQRPALPPAFLN